MNTKEETEDRRIALVFPPAIHPTGPPLGAAALKAFLLSRDPSRSVRVFDLNLAHYEQALRWMREGRLKMSLRKMDHASSAERVADTFRFLRGEKGLDAFASLPDYDEHAGFFSSFETVLNGLFDSFARKLLASLRVPPLADEYFRELIRPVKRFRPRLAGFSILFSQQVYFAAILARYLKEDDATIVFGGATLSVMPRPEVLLADRTVVPVGETRAGIPFGRFIDGLIVGEGETGIDALAGAGGCDPAHVPGLVYSDAGRVRRNGPRRIEKLEELPLPDFDDCNPAAYLSPMPILPYLSSRGCFWRRCAFCTHRKTYLAYREEPPEYTVSRLAELSRRHGAVLFSLVDEMIHPHRFSRLARKILEAGLDIRYAAYAKPTARFDAALLGRLHASGARVVMWGVESGNQRVLDLMRKGTRADRMGRVLEDARRAGIRNLVFVMFGFPSETRQEREDTMRFLEAHRDSIDALSKSRFILLEGADMLETPERFHITRVLDRTDRDPVSVAFDYEVSDGPTQAEARRFYEERMPYLNRFGRSPFFPRYRDHMLVHAVLRDSPRESTQHHE
ncbi:B12-binding domain-containing radical SAM protein [Syntrophobacter fumaroxidans]|uniref:Radical SAM domain protein n=1 Tax=Syntrophobacter fumaroxidans (strain DSM 10017 / MPOB) TaxID=335543 RepID=A0LKE0_SYNFM|nr:radical SAM protein [Syntrophobacter fumaroxidans]ABK17892.1 Radical SAM domain protein [Syntrophobacter fumaroxidans MPOB]